ncbi:MAG: Rieske 2Fe-2S domain-containing protein [Verrucomicrobiota bacterium]
MSLTEHDLGSVDEFVVGNPHPVQVGKRPILVVRTAERLFAVRDLCPHAGAALSAGKLIGETCVEHPDAEVNYRRKGEVISCPWHGWEFDLKTGQCLADPDRWRIAVYAIEVVDGRVMLKT